MLPLQGILVVSLEHAVAAPLATRHLADLGARVIKIERPGTGDFSRSYDVTVDGLSSYFVWLNRTKESVALDLSKETDRALFSNLLRRADVFVHNLAPGAVERLGFDPAVLRRERPEMITCAISGYGADGPYAGRKAYDLLIQCDAGLVSVTGHEDAPAKVGVSIADIATGMYAYSQILAALLARARYGTGRGIEIAMLDALAEWMSQPALYAAYSGRRPPRTGPRHASIAPYGPFPTADGPDVFIAIQNAREWTVFCSDVLRQPELIEDPRFATNPLRVANVAELTDIISALTKTLTTADLVARLDAAAIANATLRDVAELIDHPQLAARQRWTTVDSPNGPVHALVPPGLAGPDDMALGPIPALGQHTDAIRAEFASA